jgi:hypothetical protein
MQRRWLFLSLAVGLIAGLAFGTPSQAGSIPFTYTSAITSENLSYTYVGNAAGTVTPGVVSPGSGTIASAPSLLGAADPVGTFPYTYTGGAFPTDYYTVSGTVDLKVTVTIAGAGGGSGSYTVVENYANLVTSNGIPPAPALTGLGNSDVIGKYLVTLNAIAEGANSNVPGGSSINVGFEYSLIPEPSSMALLGVGMVGLFTYRRLFRRFTVA